MMKAFCSVLATLSLLLFSIATMSATTNAFTPTTSTTTTTTNTITHSSSLAFLVPRHDCTRSSSTTTTLAAAPAGPDLIEKKDTETKKKVGGGWEIRLYNDPINKREFVSRCLTTICGKSDSESYQIMMEAHNNGIGVIGRWAFEVAELYYNSLKENNLTVDMVPVDGNDKK